MSNYGINKGKRKRNIYILSIQKGAMKIILYLGNGCFLNGNGLSAKGFLKILNAGTEDIN